MMFPMSSAVTPSEPGSPLIGTLRGSARPARLATVVVEELAGRIIAGVLPEGSVLPTESVLCDEFGFSRTVLREGLKLLEERGLVRVEQGRGTTVQARELWNLLDPTVLRIALEHDPDMQLLDNLITVRRLLESEMARVAASRLSERRAQRASRQHRRDDGGRRRLSRVPAPRPGLPRAGHEGLWQRDRQDDRSRHPPARGMDA